MATMHDSCGGAWTGKLSIAGKHETILLSDENTILLQLLPHIAHPRVLL